MKQWSPQNYIINISDGVLWHLLFWKSGTLHEPLQSETTPWAAIFENIYCYCFKAIDSRVMLQDNIFPVKSFLQSILPPSPIHCILMMGSMCLPWCWRQKNRGIIIQGRTLKIDFCVGEFYTSGSRDCGSTSPGIIIHHPNLCIFFYSFSTFVYILCSWPNLFCQSAESIQVHMQGRQPSYQVGTALTEGIRRHGKSLTPGAPCSLRWSAADHE